MNHSEKFYNLFFNSLDLGFETETVVIFWLIFCPFDPDPWIRIFLRIRIQVQQHLSDTTDPDPKHCLKVMVVKP